MKRELLGYKSAFSVDVLHPFCKRHKNNGELKEEKLYVEDY